MPLDLPDLDDRRYRDLMEEALHLIPANAPRWTNHNPSDPGITLIELFAFITEALMYRVNRVTSENVFAFMKLLNGPDWTTKAETWTAAPPEERARLVAETITAFATPVRAVSCADFEVLARAVDPGIARARCVPDEDNRLRLRVLPNPHGDETTDTAQRWAVTDELIKRVEHQLEDCRLLGTSVDVRGPALCEVGVQLTLVLEADARGETVKAAAIAAMTESLNPRTWSFGRHVYDSEIYRVLAGVPGVRAVRASGAQTPILKAVRRLDPIGSEQSEEDGLYIAPDELPTAKIDPDAIKTTDAQP